MNKFEEARQVEQAGQRDQAEDLYRKITFKYPNTPGAEKAKARLEKIRKEREQELLKASLPILQDFQEVIEGYRSMYGSYPQSLKDLDNGEYFFDSDYLAESAPAGFDVYLSLGAAAGGYRIWVVPQGAVVGFMLDGTHSGVRKLTRDDILAEIERTSQRKTQKGQVAFLETLTERG